MTDNSAFKNQVRARMAETGEKYTIGRRKVIAGHDAGQPPVILRVHLNPHLDLELTAQAGQVYAGADDQAGEAWLTGCSRTRSRWPALTKRRSQPAQRS